MKRFMPKSLKEMIKKWIVLVNRFIPRALKVMILKLLCLLLGPPEKYENAAIYWRELGLWRFKIFLANRSKSRQRRWIVSINRFIPSPLKKMILRLVSLLLGPPDKYKAELSFWQHYYLENGGRFDYSSYQKKMLGIAQENDTRFLEGKVVADFGCGPRGSLCWIKSAKELIGIDVLADDYVSLFDLSSQGMRYVKSSEKHIPLPSCYVDVLFTLNAMDHVKNFEVMCKELLRILKLGGSLMGSFNLDMPATITEPHTLTEQRIQDHLLVYLQVQSYRMASPGPPDKGEHCHFFDNSPSATTGPRFLWVRATKPFSLPVQ